MDPTRLALLVMFAAIAVGLAVVRRESLSVTALNAGGGIIFVTSIFWATALSPAASFAALGASLGGILFSLGALPGRRARAKPEAA